MVGNMLHGIEVKLGVDYLADKEKWDSMAEHVIYTGPIDAYFHYALGPLEYRSVRFETEVLDKPNFQGNAAVNYTDRETSWTRIIEHKWFEFGKDSEGNDLPKTVISENTLRNGKWAMSHTIRSMMRRMARFIRNISSWQKRRRRSFSVDAWRV